MGETEIKSTKDLKQYIQINAYDNKIELWKLEWGINSFEAGLRERLRELTKETEQPIYHLDAGREWWGCPYCDLMGGESKMTEHVVNCQKLHFSAVIDELRRILDGE